MARYARRRVSKTSGGRGGCAGCFMEYRSESRTFSIPLECARRQAMRQWRTSCRTTTPRWLSASRPPAPVVAVGDGALGFWAAAREVWPATREQGCWVHMLVNVLDKLPPRLQPRAKRALHEMMYAESRADCETARARFAAEFQPKYAKAVESLTANWERLVTFFDFPAEH